MLKAVIMDFDGVILDTETVWYTIFKDWLQEKYGYNLSIPTFLTCVGSDDDLLFAKLAAEEAIYIDEKQFKAETTKMFVERSKNLPEMAGVTEFVKLVKESGLKLALATSSQKKKPYFHLTRLGLLDYFDVIVTAEQVTNIKPAPDLFLEALKQLAVKPAEAVIIEDSNNGLIAGNRAGIPVIIVPNQITIHSEFKGSLLVAECLQDIDFTKYSVKG